MSTREISVRLVNARLAASMTQAEAATELGVSTRTVQKWESGRVAPRLPLRRRVLAFIAQHEEAA